VQDAQLDDAKARDLLQEMDPILRITGGTVPYSVTERARTVGTMYAFNQWYGPPSLFFTFSPDDSHSKMVMKMYSVDEKRTVGPLLQSMAVNTSVYQLQRLMSMNPVASTEVFHIMLDSVFKSLFGHESAEHVKRSTPLSTYKRGVLGTCPAAIAACEVQGRDSHHAHMFVWSVLSGQVVQACAVFSALSKLVVKVFDSQLTAQLSKQCHFQGVARLLTFNKDRVPQLPMVMRLCPKPSEEEAFRAYFEEGVERLNVHQHGPACHHPSFNSCRFAKPEPCVPNTMFVQLEHADTSAASPFK
jgi:hypothetical protein